MYRSRWNKVKAYLKKKRMDAFIVRGVSNIRYLYASHLPHDSSLASFLVIFRKGGVVAITSSLEAHRTRTQGAPGASIRTFSSYPEVKSQHKNFKEALETILKKARAKKVLCDASMKVRGIKVVEDEILGKIRAIKEEEELRRIKAACKITDMAAAKLEDLIVPGATERSVLRDLNYIMYKCGADSLAFETIVASGPHSSYPHHDLADRKFKKGDPVTCDFGAIYRGYCADLTRTYFAGTPSKEMAEVYKAVYESYKAGVKASKVGNQLGNIDLACREVLNDRGYGKYYVHSTGHGVGLDVHEEPRVIPGNKEKVQGGMVFTVEPGVYIPDLGGVRIENDIYARPVGPLVLNKAKIPTY